MDNEEKKRFLEESHALYMERRPYDGVLTIEQARAKEDVFWREYKSVFYSRLPKTLFKYRKGDDRDLENLENDVAWFSHPEDFDDTLDSTINNDIESEIREYEGNRNKFIQDYSKKFLFALANRCGVNAELETFEDAAPLVNLDGSFNERKTQAFLAQRMPNKEVNECMAMLRRANARGFMRTAHKAMLASLRNYLNINKRQRHEFLAFSLAEEGGNRAMWSLYANESKGFCIEYAFPEYSFLSQRMLLNLNPIYYGEKPTLKFFDLLIRGAMDKNSINGVAPEDYCAWHVSTFTKDDTFKFQKEWRITFDKRMGGNLQPFPFAVAVTLGERMDEEVAERLMDIAKKKGLKIYRRSFDLSMSDILITELV